MTALLSPQTKLRKILEEQTGAQSCMCWTCSSCLAECPVNVATNRLSPMKIARLANLGLVEELINLPEIWYCLTCNRCQQICPNQVSPVAIISHIRRGAVHSLKLSFDLKIRYRELFYQLHMRRWEIANQLLNESRPPFSQIIKDSNRQAISPAMLVRKDNKISRLIKETNLSACFTCGECSSACPVFSGTDIFDPRWIFRMINYGYIEELIGSPHIWLCISCQRCTNACSQKVQGHLAIQRLRELAVEEGMIDVNFQMQVYERCRELFDPLVDEIDRLFDLKKEKANRLSRTEALV